MAVAGAVLIILGKRKGPTAAYNRAALSLSRSNSLTRIIPAILFAESVELVLVELLLAGTETRWR